MTFGVARWQFQNPVRVRFGRGCRDSLSKDLAGLRCLIVTSKRGRLQIEADPVLGPIVASMKGSVWIDGVRANPDLTDLEGELQKIRSDSFDAVLAFGGGSAIDSAKVFSVALSPDAGGASVPALLERQERVREIRPVRLFAVPTTAGTGSEMTPFSTVWDHASRRKLSLAGPSVFPYAAVVDPDLMDALPWDVTLTTGLDAINQAAESVWNRNATEWTLAIAFRALQLGFAALPALRDGGGPEDRARMAECSLLAGLAISQTRTALCHAMSYPITAHFGVPHGLACAFTMRAVLRFNLQAEDGRFSKLAATLNAGDTSPDGLVRRFDQLCESLGVRRLVASKVGDLDRLTALAGEMWVPGRSDNNLRGLEPSAIAGLLSESWNLN